jgi:hemoglobin
MDIETKEDIKTLVDTFYGRVRQDNRLGPIFNTIIGDHWEQHLPKMYSFWGMSLMGEGGYTGNAVQKHVAIDQQMPLQDAHFERWIGLWQQTVDELFEGKRAEDAKKKAELMLQLIRIKVDAGRTGKSLY